MQAAEIRGMIDTLALLQSFGGGDGEKKMQQSIQCKLELGTVTTNRPSRWNGK
jgi:hypothetical protein